MKSNAQRRRDDSDDEVPPPTAMPVDFPDMASSSHTVPPSEPEVNYAQIMEALAALQGGMSSDVCFNEYSQAHESFAI
jgi:hypothetical protein